MSDALLYLVRAEAGEASLDALDPLHLRAQAPHNLFGVQLCRTKVKRCGGVEAVPRWARI